MTADVPEASAFTARMAARSEPGPASLRLVTAVENVPLDELGAGLVAGGAVVAPHPDDAMSAPTTTDRLIACRWCRIGKCS
jgi:hypothetical protein